MTQAERAKIIYNVISATKKKTEPSLTATDGKTEKAKCHVCGITGHKMKKCWYYDPKMTLDENKKAAEQKIKEKQAAKKEKADTIFGKTWILRGRRGSVLVSQYSTKKMYQVINPDEETFILKGWDYNPETKRKTSGMKTDMMTSYCIVLLT
jgi:hypothetical protein